MAAIVIRGTVRAAWLTGLASLRARACDMARRATACAAAAVMVCAVGAALVQLAAQILSFSAPIAVTGITVMTAAVLNVLRRRLLPGPSTGRSAGMRPDLSRGRRDQSDPVRALPLDRR
jgi:hypothetical protein